MTKQGEDALGNRMKSYEECSTYKLPAQMPVIIRLDGRAFHTFTRGMERPFDARLVEMMNAAAVATCDEVSGARLAYLQSDEISILVENKPGAEAWFGNVLAKLTSISATVATAVAMQWKYKHDLKPDALVMFDGRAFVLPVHEVNSYFVWRQSDWARNSLQMLARSLYSQRELKGKKKADMHELIFQKGKNWADLPPHLKNGRCVVKVEANYRVDNEHFHGEVTRQKWEVDNNVPVFSQVPAYVTSHLACPPVPNFQTKSL